MIKFSSKIAMGEGHSRCEQLVSFPLITGHANKVPTGHRGPLDFPMQTGVPCLIGSIFDFLRRTYMYERSARLSTVMSANVMLQVASKLSREWM